jgi:hypothetical protein
MSFPVFDRINFSLDKFIQNANQLQGSIADVFNAIFAKPQLDCTLITNYQLLSGQVNHVPHQLGKKLRGWHLERLRTGAKVWDTQDANTNQQTYLDLWTDTNTTVDITCF